MGKNLYHAWGDLRRNVWPSHSVWRTFIDTIIRRSNLNKTIDLVHVWSDQLFAWRSLLHPSLQYPPSTNASVSMLQWVLLLT